MLVRIALRAPWGEMRGVGQAGAVIQLHNCPQQSRLPHAARNPKGTGGLWPNLVVDSRRRWGPSPSVSLRELDSQDPCSRPHSNTRTGS